MLRTHERTKEHQDILRGGFFLGLSSFFLLTCGTELFLPTSVAASLSLRTGDDIYDNLAVVFAALGARTVRYAQSAALAFRETACRKGLVAPAAACL